MRHVEPRRDKREPIKIIVKSSIECRKPTGRASKSNVLEGVAEKASTATNQLFVGKDDMYPIGFLFIKLTR